MHCLDGSADDEWNAAELVPTRMEGDRYTLLVIHTTLHEHRSVCVKRAPVDVVEGVYKYVFIIGIYLIEVSGGGDFRSLRQQPW